MKKDKKDDFRGKSLELGRLLHTSTDAAVSVCWYQTVDLWCWYILTSMLASRISYQNCSDALLCHLIKLLWKYIAGFQIKFRETMAFIRRSVFDALSVQRLNIWRGTLRSHFWRPEFHSVVEIGGYVGLGLRLAPRPYLMHILFYRCLRAQVPISRRWNTLEDKV